MEWRLRLQTAIEITKSSSFTSPCTFLIFPHAEPTSLHLGELRVGDGLFVGLLVHGSLWFVGLARGAVDGLDPQGALRLLVRREHDVVSLLHRVEEEPTTFHLYKISKFVQNLILTDGT